MSRIDPVGEIIDNRFRIDAPLGEGGFAAVYQAEQIGMNRKVAVKFLHLEATADDDLLERFKREAKILAALNHKNIVACYAYGLWRNRIPYLVLEYLEGETLQHQLAREKLLPWEEAFRYGIELCDGLAELHSNQIIHRDLKPENIMVTTDGRVKIIDFGLAAVDGQRLTQAGTLVGSLFYLSPEQATASQITSSSDIYSLGCVLYRVIAGVQPFDGLVPVEVLYKHVNEQPAPLTAAMNSSIPHSVEKIIATAMQKDPRSRFRNATEFGAAMQSALQCEVHAVPLAVEGSQRRQTVRPGARLNGKLSLVALILLASTGAGAVLLFLSQGLRDARHEDAVLRIKDDLERAYLTQTITPDMHPGLVNWQQKVEPVMVMYLPGSNSARAGTDADRISVLNDAVTLAAQEKVGDHLRAQVLMSQLNSWLSTVDTYNHADLEIWLEKAKSLLSSAELSKEERQKLSFLVRTVEGKVYFPQMHQIREKLIANIYRPDGYPLEPASLNDLENHLSSIVRLIPPDKPLASLIDLPPLQDYVILLSGTHRGLEAQIFLRPYLDSVNLTQEERRQLEDALIYAQVSCGSSRDALASIRRKLDAGEAADLVQVHLTGLINRGLSGDVHEAEEAVELRLKGKPIDGEDYINRQIQLAAVSDTKGHHKEALAILKGIVPMVRTREKSHWSFGVFRAITLAYIASGELQLAQTSLRDAQMSLKKWPSLATPVCLEKFDALKAMLDSQLELQHLEQSGLGQSIEAFKLRSGFMQGTFHYIHPFIEKRALRNLEAIGALEKRFTRQHIWQCVHDLLLCYDEGNRPNEALSFHVRYQPQISQLAETGMAWGPRQIENNNFMIDHFLSRAFYRQGQFNQALKFSLAAMKQHCKLAPDNRWMYAADLPSEFISHHAHVAASAKSLDPKGSAELASYVIQALQRRTLSGSRMELESGVAEILCQGGLAESSDILYNEAANYFQKENELSWQLLNMRRRCTALCKSDRYADSDKIAQQALSLSSGSSDPLIKVLRVEFESLLKTHKLPTIGV